MKVLQAKIVSDYKETLEEIKEQRDRYKYILDVIYKEVILKDSDEFSKEDYLEYLEYLLKDYIKEKEKKNEK